MIFEIFLWILLVVKMLVTATILIKELTKSYAVETYEKKQEAHYRNRFGTDAI